MAIARTPAPLRKFMVFPQIPVMESATKMGTLG
jgi:hypothetical protein